MIVRVLSISLLALMGFAVVPAHADDTAASATLTIKDHKFDPAEITVPANQPVKLTIKNMDNQAEEFESHTLKREKIVPANGEITITLRPLKAGDYKFFGDFHQDTAQGVLKAE